MSYAYQIVFYEHVFYTPKGTLSSVGGMGAVSSSLSVVLQSMWMSLNRMKDP